MNFFINFINTNILILQILVSNFKEKNKFILIKLLEILKNYIERDKFQKTLIQFQKYTVS
jgi:hypothetical protein